MKTSFFAGTIYNARLNQNKENGEFIQEKEIMYN